MNSKKAHTICLWCVTYSLVKPTKKTIYVTLKILLFYYLKKLYVSLLTIPNIYTFIHIIHIVFIANSIRYTCMYMRPVLSQCCSFFFSFQEANGKEKLNWRLFRLSDSMKNYELNENTRGNSTFVLRKNS